MRPILGPMIVFALLLGGGAPLKSQHRSSATFSKPVLADVPVLYLAGDRVTRAQVAPAPDKLFAPAQVDSTRAHSPSVAGHAVVGAIVGGVIGAIWIGNWASSGYPNSETAMSPDSGRIFGAVVGIVTGAGIGALVAVIRRSEASSIRRGM